jgi:hypothetical protein
MKLTKKQIEIVENEFRFKSIIEPSFRQYSRKLWNKCKINAWITFKDGEYLKADNKGWLT